MKLSVIGKQIDLGDALRSHVESVLTAVTAKYFSQAIDATVVFTREAHRMRADLAVHVSRNLAMQSVGLADSPYLAFDQAAEKLGKRMRRYKRRLSDHNKDQAVELEPALAARSYVLEAEPEEPAEGHEEPAQPVVIAEMAMAIDALTVSQAVMRLDLGDLPALMFRNRAHGGLNMVYRRADGNVGWVDPQGGSSA